MTSPDFMYPQPTDDELAAQQPRAALPGGHSTASGTGHVHSAEAGHVHSTGHAPALVAEANSDASASEANRSRLGKVALAAAIVAAGLSLSASFILGVTIAPMEADYGYRFGNTPDWYRNLAIALFGLQALCAALGITGLIMGVAAASGRGRTQGIVAIAITVLAPFVSFGLFMILSFTFA